MKQSLTGILVLSNAAIAVAYVAVASKAWWIDPALADIPGARGGAPFVWFWASGYALGIVALLNLGFLTMHLYAYFKKRERRLGVAALMIPLIWGATVYVDFLHH